nr:MAG TPA: hypothetical protein [Caudoviricetes sp.]
MRKGRFMDNNLLNTILNLLEKIEDETNLSSDDITKAFKQLFPAIEKVGSDEGDVLDDIVYDNLNSNDIKNVIFYCVDLLEKVFTESINKKHKFMKNDLEFIFPSKEEFKNELSLRTKIDTRNLRLFLVIKTFLKGKINELHTYSKVTPKAERIIKGKTPKAKKPDQIKAEEWAKDIWGKDPTITQENMAYQLKDKLDLNQSIRTIINWIKPFQPKP